MSGVSPAGTRSQTFGSATSTRSPCRARPCSALQLHGRYDNDYIRDDSALHGSHRNAAEIQRFGVQQGDVMITKDSETPDDIGIPAVGWIRSKAWSAAITWHKYGQTERSSIRFTSPSIWPARDGGVLRTARRRLDPLWPVKRDHRGRADSACASGATTTHRQSPRPT